MNNPRRDVIDLSVQLENLCREMVNKSLDCNFSVKDIEPGTLKLIQATTKEEFFEDEAWVRFKQDLDTFNEEKNPAVLEKRVQDLRNAHFILTTLSPYISDPFVLCQFLRGGQIELDVDSATAKALYEKLYEHDAASPRFSSHGKAAVLGGEKEFKEKGYRSGGEYHAEIAAGSLIPNVLFWLHEKENGVTLRFQTEKYAEYANASLSEGRCLILRLFKRLIDKVYTVLHDLISSKPNIKEAFFAKKEKASVKDGSEPSPVLSFDHFLTFAQYLWHGKKNIGPGGLRSVFNDASPLRVITEKKSDEGPKP